MNYTTELTSFQKDLFCEGLARKLVEVFDGKLTIESSKESHIRVSHWHCWLELYPVSFTYKLEYEGYYHKPLYTDKIPTDKEDFDHLVRKLEEYMGADFEMLE